MKDKIRLGELEDSDGDALINELADVLHEQVKQPISKALQRGLVLGYMLGKGADHKTEFTRPDYKIWARELARKLEEISKEAGAKKGDKSVRVEPGMFLHSMEILSQLSENELAQGILGIVVAAKILAKRGLVPPEPQEAEQAEEPKQN